MSLIRAIARQDQRERQQRLSDMRFAALATPEAFAKIAASMNDDDEE